MTAAFLDGAFLAAFFAGAFFAAGFVVGACAPVAGAGSGTTEDGAWLTHWAGGCSGVGPPTRSTARPTTRAVVRTPVAATPTAVPATAAAAWAGSWTSPEAMRMGFTRGPLVVLVGSRAPVPDPGAPRP
ncbi:hypothetical protein EXE59_12805 [Nocardioides eburneiflavus]|uniref:Uncharacterized protein n=1 Tax=Nocardioides eburneiflavus TaxID=2518372 RepID=A0A4Z1CMI0_9ACTN|nr:hypothetical protein EXE59_12805 [Nocardioides eburneiflavus]